MSNKLLAQGQLNGATSTVVAPTNTARIIDAFCITNTSDVESQTFNLYFVQSGATESAANQIANSEGVAARQTITVDQLINQVLPANATIVGNASVSVVMTYHVSGRDIL